MSAPCLPIRVHTDRRRAGRAQSPVRSSHRWRRNRPVLPPGSANFPIAYGARRVARVPQNVEKKIAAVASEASPCSQGRTTRKFQLRRDGKPFALLVLARNSCVQDGWSHAALCRCVLTDCACRSPCPDSVCVSTGVAGLLFRSHASSKRNKERNASKSWGPRVSPSCGPLDFLEMRQVGAAGSRTHSCLEFTGLRVGVFWLSKRPIWNHRDDLTQRKDSKIVD
jgi:hypothetical protein